MGTTNTLIDAALRYGSRARAVFPCWWVQDGHCACPAGTQCSSPGKHPLTAHGVLDATADESKIRALWRRWPEANVALATGSRSGFIALDIDPRHGGEEALAAVEAEIGRLPDTICVLTQSKGRHLYYRAPEATVACSASTLGRGLDVRGDGGYVVAPPSTGVLGQYIWDSPSGDPDGSLAELPPAWIERLVGRRQAVAALPISGPVPEGRRNDTLASVAGALRRRGLEPEVILAALLAVNEKQCQPPLPEEEVSQIARSVGRYPIPTGGGRSGPDGQHEPVIVAGDLQLRLGRRLSATSVEIYVERETQLLYVDRVSPASSGSRRRLIGAIQSHDATVDVAALDLRLCALAERLTAMDTHIDQGIRGTAVAFDAVEPSPNPVDGGQLLRDLVSELLKYMVIKQAAAVVTAVWLVAAHTFSVFDVFPRIVVRSPTKRCGKTRLLDLLEALLANSQKCSNLSLASLFRVVDDQHPVLLLDETDLYLKAQPELIGLLNAGHKRGGAVLRCEGEDSEVRRFDVFAPAVLAGIGDQADTVMDRSFIISMQRRAMGEEVAKLRMRELRELRSRLVPQILRWIADHVGDLSEAQPEVPDGLDDRAADNAVPLLAVADLVGGDWPVVVRTSIVQLCGAREEADDGKALLLLGDLRDLFNTVSGPGLATKGILKLLHEREDRPWAEYGRSGKPIAGWHVGNLLAEFSVRSAYVLDPMTGKKARGYLRADLEATWSRYLSPSPLRDSVPSPVSSPKAAEDGESELRAAAGPERSEDWPSEPDPGAEAVNATEPRSRDGELPHVVADGAAADAHGEDQQHGDDRPPSCDGAPPVAGGSPLTRAKLVEGRMEFAIEEGDEAGANSARAELAEIVGPLNAAIVEAEIRGEVDADSGSEDD
jgi:hypothetical protein